MAYELTFTWQARTAIDSLDVEERQNVVDSLDRLRSGPNPPGLPQVYQIKGPEGLHVMRAGHLQRLRVVFTVTGVDQITIHDVFSHALVKEYFKSVMS